MQVALDDYVESAGIATELVNTAAEVWHGDDHLPDLPALVAFADLHGTGGLGDLARRARQADLRAVHALRGTVRDLIDHPERDRLVTGATALTSPPVASPSTTAPAGSSRSAPAPPFPTRFRCSAASASSVSCTRSAKDGSAPAAPTCGGAFIDTTRPGRRRYCMPGLCGNRTNVANHRARQAAAREAAG